MKIASRHRRVLDLFRFATEILGKLPRRSENWLEILVKLLAIADAFEKVFGGRARAYDEIFSRYDLSTRSSETFVRLFFDSAMHTRFRTTRYTISEHLELIEAVAPDGEMLFFQEYRHGRPEVSSEFFFTKRFNFAAAMDSLWESYGGALYISVKGIFGGITFSRVPRRDNEVVSGRARGRIAAGLAAHAAREGEPWCTIAYGPPGTGKSSYAEAIGEATGGRLLKIDASSIAHLGVQELSFLLDALCPNFLLIDDFDRAPVDETRARLLFLFEHLKATHPRINITVTVNKPDALDEALLHSGRIDEAVNFPLPDDEERGDVLAQHLALHASRLLPGTLNAVERLTVETDGFNHADLGGLVRRLRRLSVEEALGAMKTLRDLASQAAKKSEKKPGDTPPTP